MRSIRRKLRETHFTLGLGQPLHFDLRLAASEVSAGCRQKNIVIAAIGAIAHKGQMPRIGRPCHHALAATAIVFLRCSDPYDP